MYFVVQKVQEVVERTALVKQAYNSLTEAECRHHQAMVCRGGECTG